MTEKRGFGKACTLDSRASRLRALFFRKAGSWSGRLTAVTVSSRAVDCSILSST